MVVISWVTPDCELAHLGDPGARAERLGARRAHGAAEVEQRVDLVALLGGELGVGLGLGQLVGGGRECPRRRPPGRPGWRPVDWAATMARSAAVR